MESEEQKARIKVQKGDSIQKWKQMNKDSKIKQEGPAKEKTKEQTMV